MFERLSKFVRAAALMTAFVETLLYCGTKDCFPRRSLPTRRATVQTIDRDSASDSATHQVQDGSDTENPSERDYAEDSSLEEGSEAEESSMAKGSDTEDSS